MLPPTLTTPVARVGVATVGEISVPPYTDRYRRLHDVLALPRRTLGRVRQTAKLVSYSSVVPK
jgi:hypothetical protein